MVQPSKSASQRKREQRDRDRAAGLTPITVRLTAEARAEFDRLAAEHGGQDQAIAWLLHRPR